MILACFDLDVGPKSLEFIKNQFERFDFGDDGINPFGINGISGFLLPAVQDLKITIHICGFQEPACGCDLPRLRTRPNGFRKFKKLFHLGLGRSVKKLEIFIENGLDIQVTIPTEFVVQIQHNVGNPRPGHIGFIFRFSSKLFAPTDFCHKTQGMVVKTMEIFLHQLGKHNRNGRKIIIGSMLKIIFPNKQLVFVHHLGNPLIAIFQLFIRIHPESARFAKNNRHIIRNFGERLGRLSRDSIRKNGEFFIGIFFHDSLAEIQTKIPGVIAKATIRTILCHAIPTRSHILVIQK